MVLEISRPDAIDATLIRRIRYRPIRVSPKTEWAFVEVETAEGLCGIGEATFYRGAHDFPNTVRAYAKQLEGAPLSALRRKTLVPQEDDVIGWAVLSAIEHAGWDIYGKTVGQPVHALLGERLRRKVPLYANINRRTTNRAPAGFVESIQKASADGFDKFKIAPFDGMSPGQTDDDVLFQAGLDRIRAAHDAMDGQGTLMVDCHWRLDFARAVQVLDLATELKLGWIECPLLERADTLADLRKFKSLSAQAGIVVAGGEQGTCFDYFNRILNEGIYDIIMPDVKYVGGIQQLLRIANLAERYQTTFSPHNPSGPVAHLASLHAMMVTPNLSILESQYDEDPLFWTLNALSMPVTESALSDAPMLDGLGFSTANFPD